MAEVGLLPFARVALQVATQVLPPYRSRFSKHQFTQPQLLAVLCLMRYEDWTFREAEVRWREHQEWRAAWRLQAVPDYTTLYRFLRRLEDDTVDRGLQETVLRLRRRRSRPISAAIDGTGLSDTSVSTFFHRRLEQHAHGPRPRRPWLKWLIVVDVRQQILLAQRARQGPGCDARALPGLLDVAAQGAPIRVVLADAELDSEANYQPIRQRLGAKSIIPARRRGPERRYSQSEVPRLSEETVSATLHDRKHLLRRQTQTLLARTRTQPGHPGPPSPVARPCLQHLPPEASVCSGRMSTEPKCCKQRIYRIAKPFRCNTYEKQGGGGCSG